MRSCSSLPPAIQPRVVKQLDEAPKKARASKYRGIASSVHELHAHISAIYSRKVQRLDAEKHSAHTNHEPCCSKYVPRDAHSHRILCGRRHWWRIIVQIGALMCRGIVVLAGRVESETIVSNDEQKSYADDRSCLRMFHTADSASLYARCLTVVRVENGMRTVRTSSKRHGYDKVRRFRK